MIDTKHIPTDLRGRAQWVCWRRELRGGRETKVPYRADGRGRASATDPATWSSFDAALCAYWTGMFSGIGFALSGDDPFTAIDLDDAIDDDGVTAPWATEIVTTIDSYTELSPSARGYRIFVRGDLPLGGNRRGHVELYDCARYVTVTGSHVAGTPLTIRQRDAEVRAIHRRFIAPPAPTADSPPATGASAQLDDPDLLARAMRAKNGEKFARLWAGDIAGYASPSEAELALCAILAFWTGGDRNRIDRLFRKSALMRQKWDERRGLQTVGSITIARALR